jgi:hypothetical protein
MRPLHTVSEQRGNEPLPGRGRDSNGS